jgi:CDP-diglyceride synthetase
MDTGRPRRRSWTSGRSHRLLGSPLARKQATHGIYIEIVVLAVILALEHKNASDRDIVSTVLVAMLVVLLADLYAYYIGSMIGDGRRPTSLELREATIGELGGLVASVPPVFVLMLGVAGVIGLQTAFTLAKWAGVVMIGLYALVAHKRAGLAFRESLPATVFLVLLGVVLVGLKYFVH